MAQTLHIHSFYDHYWAISVVNKTLEAHARVTDSFFEFTGLSRSHLVTLLETGRPEWALLRDMLKQGDLWAEKQDSLGLEYAKGGSEEFWKAIFTRKRASYPQNLNVYLDKQIKLGLELKSRV